MSSYRIIFSVPYFVLRHDLSQSLSRNLMIYHIIILHHKLKETLCINSRECIYRQYGQVKGGRFLVTWEKYKDAETIF